MRGWLAYIAQAQSDERQLEGYARLQALLGDFQARPILDYDAASIAKFRRLRKAKVRLGTMDLKIAAIALAHKARLLTRNLADFRKVPDLQAEDWTTVPVPEPEPPADDSV